MKKTVNQNLSVVQGFLNDAASEFRLAQAAYKKASERLASAESNYQQAQQQFNVAVAEVMTSSKVKPIGTF